MQCLRIDLGAPVTALVIRCVVLRTCRAAGAVEHRELRRADAPGAARPPTEFPEDAA
jgi:hypothetical protein